MSQVIRERNSGTQCFSTIRLDSGERVMVSIAAGEVVICKLKWAGLFPSHRLWSSADPDQLARVFFDTDLPTDHPLESVRNAVLECRSTDELLALIGERDGAVSAVSTLPTSFDVTRVDDVMLIDTVRTAFGSLLEKDASQWHGCIYRPASLLPFPKPTIRAALQALLDVAERRQISPHIDSSFLTPEATDHVRVALRLLDDFIERPDSEIPTDPRANVLYGVAVRGDA